jgi:hypothetical protein
MGLESCYEQEIFLFSKTVQTGSVANPASHSMGTTILPQEKVKQPGHEVDHFSSFGGSVKN